MKQRVVFLLEEPSMKTFLEGFLPRLIPDWRNEVDFLCIPHRGKSDLDRSINIKLKAWREPGVRFVILRDNDGADCRELKNRLRAVCSACGRPETLIRLVCQELESRNLGDPEALRQAYPQARVDPATLQRRYQNPDLRRKPSDDIARLIPTFQKHDGARRPSEHLSAEHNRSHSFQVFVAAVRRLALERTAAKGDHSC